MQNRKTVSLVLGSGGARGLAHIGVIDWFVEHDYDIRSIAGSSMGALVGGIFAAGKLDDYCDWVCALDKTDVLGLLDISLSWSGFFKGDKVINTLKNLIGDKNIEDLDISFTAVATDIEQQKEVWLNKGPLFNAIRASIAFPLVFTPFKYQGRQLLDGSLLNPLPIAPTLNDATDLTVAVNLSGAPPKRLPQPAVIPVNPHSLVSPADYTTKIKSFIFDLQKSFRRQNKADLDYFDIISLSFDTMQNTIARMKLATYTPDITIEISHDCARAFEFYRARELIDLGYQSAERTMHGQASD